MTLGTFPAVGGHVLGDWTMPVRGPASASPLAVTGITPSSCAVGGGCAVTIVGAGFDAATELLFGGTAARPESATATQLRVTAPAAPAAGPVTVAVHTGAGDRLDLPGAFTYLSPLSVTTITPGAVGLAGGEVTISGEGFTRGMTALLGGAIVPTSTYDFGASPQTFKTTVPAGAAGWIDLQLRQAGAPSLVVPRAVLRKDALPPKLVRLEPMDTSGYQGVPLDTVFTLEFDEPLDPATSGKIKLTRLVGGAEEPGSITLSPDGRRVTFAPASPLRSTISYVLYYNGVADLYGNAIQAWGQAQFWAKDVIPPSVSFSVAGRSEPVPSGALLSAATPWTFALNVQDDSGCIAEQTLQIDGVTLTPDYSTHLFAFTWPSTAAGSTSRLVATARDCGGNVSEYVVTAQITDDIPPTCTLTSPAADVSLEEGAALDVSATASDNRVVASLQASLGGTVVKRLVGLTGPTASLSQRLVLAPVSGSAAEARELVISATDDRGLSCAAPRAIVTVRPDATAPVVSFQTPTAGAHVVSGAAVDVGASATDGSGIASVELLADGVSVARLTSPPWSFRWTAPRIQATTLATLALRARDVRGNEGTASIQVTVDPPAGKPVVSLSAPADSSVTEGAAVTVTANATAPAGIDHVRLSIDGQELRRDQPPYSAIFVAPATSPGGRYATVRAVAVDRTGQESVPATRKLWIADDGAPAPVVSVASDVAGGVFAGGSTVHAFGHTDRTGSGTTTLTVAGALVGAAGPFDEASLTLPLGPEAAPVRVAASLTGTGGTAEASVSGSLAVLARGPAVVVDDGLAGARVTGVALQGEYALVLVDLGGRTSVLEVRRRSDGARVASLGLAGAPAGVAFAGDRAAVALQTAAGGVLEYRRVPDLAPVRSIALPRPPSALAPFRAGVLVGTEDGLEVRDGAGALVGRAGVGPVTAVARDGDRAYVLSGGILRAVDLSAPHAPRAAAGVDAAGASRVAAVSGGACAAGTRVACFTSASDGTLTLRGASAGRATGARDDTFDAPLDGATWTKTDIGGLTSPAARTEAGRLLLTGVGLSMNGGASADQFTCLSQAGATGDFTVEARIETAELPFYGEAALMVRQSLAASASVASVAVTGLGAVTFRARGAPSIPSGALSADVGGVLTPVWVRLVRIGDQFTASYSRDRVAWTPVGTSTAVPMSGAVVIGLGVSSYSGTATASASFDEFRFRSATSAAFDATSTPLLSAAGHGGWLALGAESGLAVFDVRATPALAGTYPALRGAAAFSGGSALASRAGQVSVLGLARGPAVPAVSMAPASAAAAGARVPLAASIADGDLALDAYTAEVLVDGTVVDLLDSRVPETVDLPARTGTVEVGLRIRDLAGNLVSTARQLTLADDGTGPALAAVLAPGEVVEGGTFRVAAVPADPARVASVELALVEASVVTSAAAPALAADLTAPPVSTDEVVTVQAVAIDAQGRRGPPLSVQVLVKDDPVPTPPLVSLRRTGSGAILEGASVAVEAQVTATRAVREVRFSVAGELVATASQPPYLASVRMPLVTGTRTVTVEAVAIDELGRASAIAALPLSVVDDVTAPVITLDVEPPSSTVAAGSVLRARARVSDDGQLDRVAVELLLDGVSIQVGGASLDWTVPVGARPGAVIELRAAASDAAGNASLVIARRTVEAGRAPLPGIAEAGVFAGATRARLLGDRLYVVTPSGVQIATISRGPAPSVAWKGAYVNGRVPVDVAVRGRLALVAYGTGGADVVDVSDATAPRRVGGLDGRFDQVASGGGHLFVAGTGSTAGGWGAWPVDLADPGTPVLGQRMFGNNGGPILAEQSEGIVVRGFVNSVYLTRFGTQSPTSLDDGSSVTADARVRAAERSGDQLVIGTERGLELWLKTTTVSTRLASLSLPAPVRTLAVADGRAYVVSDDGWLRVVEIGAGRQAGITSVEPLDASWVTVSGGTLVALTPRGVELRPLALPGAGAGGAVSPPVAFADLSAGLAPYGRGVLVAAGSAGVRRAQTSAPGTAWAGAPVIAGTAVTQLEWSGSDLYFLDANRVRGITGALENADGTWSGDVWAVNPMSGLGAVDRFSAAPGRVWAVVGNVVRTAVPPSPTDVPSLTLAAPALDVAGDETRAVVGLGQAGSAVVGVDPSGALRLLSIATAYAADAVALAGDTAVVGGGSILAVYALDAQGGAAAVSAVATVGPVQRVRLAGRLAVVSEGAAGVELWDVSDRSAPQLTGHLPAGRAWDALVVGGQVAISDATAGVVFQPLPEIRPLPAAWLFAPDALSTVEAGKVILARGRAAGVGYDDLELVVDGVAAVRLDDAEPVARWLVPPQTPPGTLIRLQLLARGPDGRELLSAPRDVRVTASTATAPTISFSTNTATYAAGEAVDVSGTVTISGGIGPYAVRARFGSWPLGIVPLTVADAAYQSFGGPVRMPAVAATTTDALVLEVVDGAGRVASASKTLTVRVDTTAPVISGALPTSMWEGPHPNTVAMSATDDGVVSLRLFVDGAVVYSQPLGQSPKAMRYDVVLPEFSAHSTVTLTLVAEDGVGHETAVSRTYEVLESRPTVSGNSAKPPATAVEGSDVLVYGLAEDIDHDLRSLVVYADGAEIDRKTFATDQAQIWTELHYRLPARTSASSVVFSWVATDVGGRTGSATATTTLTANGAPKVSLNAVNGSPVTGYTDRFCAVGDDDAQLQSVMLTVDLTTATGPLSTCTPGGAECRQVCMDYLVPASSLPVSGVVQDVFGLGASVTQVFSVAANKPPVLTVKRLDYLVAGAAATLSASANDERSPLAWGEWRAGGAVVGTRAAPLAKSTNVDRTFTPAAGGDLLLEFEAQDAAGARALYAATVPVRAAGAGLSCTSAVPIPLNRDFLPFTGALQSAAGACGSFTSGAWLSLPFDGPVEYVTIQTAGRLAVEASCGGAWIGTCQIGGTATYGPLARDARVLVTGYNDPTVELLRARLGTGALCDPASTRYYCAGICKPDGTGVGRCATPICSTGADWRTRPGCAWAGDDDDTAPATPPGCANGLDDDGDGNTDSGSDAQCGAASGVREDFCATAIQGSLAGVPLPLRVRGSLSGTGTLSGSCGGGGAEHIWEFTAPFTGNFNFDTTLSPVFNAVYVRDATCTGTELACGWGTPISVPLFAGQTVAVIVDVGYSGYSGDYFLDISAGASGLLPPGAACDPASTTFLCAAGTCAPDGQGGNRCVSAACSDGTGADWPANPGCSWPGDTDDSAPAVIPACADGLDQDGDGKIDHPADPQCGAASGERENFCASAIAGSFREGLPVTVRGSTIGGTSVVNDCYGSGKPERIFEFTAPAAGSYRFDVEGIAGFTPSLTFHDATCLGNQLACAGPTIGAVSIATKTLSLAAGQTIAVIVEGYSTSTAGLFKLTISQP